MVRVACVAVCSILSFGANAATYYVAPSPTGSNLNPGTFAQPWATLQFAANQVSAGDVVEVRAGNHSGMRVAADGAPGLPIVFRAYAGEAPVINAPGSTPGVGIDIDTAPYVVVEGFQVLQAASIGVRVVESDHVVIRNNRIQANASGGFVLGNADDVLVEDNRIVGTTVNAGIQILGNADRLVLRRNEVLNNNGGITMLADPKFGAPGLIRDALVEANRIRIANDGVSGAMQLTGVQDSVFRNNLFYNVPRNGISVFKDIASGSSTGNLFVNNTVAMLATGRFAFLMAEAATGNTLRNNILYNANPASTSGSISATLDSLPGFSSDRNIVVDRFELSTGSVDTPHTLATWRQQTGQDQSSILADLGALFVSLIGENFRLATGSQAIDAGEARNDVLLDIEGLPRPAFTGWDIGAYEFRDLQFADGFESPP